MCFARIRSLLVGGLVLAGALSLSIPAQTVSVCQKKNRVELRSECKVKEASLGELAFETGAPPAPGADGRIGLWRADARVIPRFSLLSSPNRDLALLELRADGTGRTNHVNRASGVIRCAEFRYRASGGGLVVDASGKGEDTAVWLEEQEGDALTLRDAAFNEVRFRRVAEADPAVDCTPLEELRRVEGLPEPHPNGGIAFDAGLLYYQGEDDLVHPVGAADGAVQAPLALGVFDFPMSAEPGALWTHCNCGGSPEAVLVTLAGVQLDLINFEDLVEGRFSVSALATDPTNGRVWAAGDGRILEVATGADTLLSDRFVGLSIRGLVFDGSELWFATRKELGRMDPETLEVLESFQLPDPTFSAFGLALSGNELYLLGEADEAGVILVVEKP